MRFVRASLLFLAAALVAPIASAQDAKAPPSTKAAPRLKVKKKAAKDPGPVASFPGFEMLPNGGSRVFVDISKKVDVSEHIAPGLVTYVLKGTHVPSSNDQNALETYYYNTPVVRARLKRAKAKKDGEVDLQIQLRGDAQPTFRIVDQKGGGIRLEVDFPAGTYGTGDKNGAPPAAPQATDKPKIKVNKKASNGGGAAPAAKGPKPLRLEPFARLRRETRARLVEDVEAPRQRVAEQQRLS